MSGDIIFVTGGYDHTIKFWHPHDGVCYRSAQHADSVSHLSSKLYCTLMRTAPIIYDVLFVLQQVNGLAITPDKKYVAVAGVCVRAYVCVASASACVLYIYMCIFVHVYADKAFLIAKFTTCYICTV